MVARSLRKLYLPHKSAYTFVHCPNIIQHLQDMSLMIRVAEHHDIDLQKCATHELDWVLVAAVAVTQYSVVEAVPR